ncbi:MAG TPA: signal peptidase II [Acidimicrobiales bacterium]|nr:signal peptidase II [Acidimicrobiales bacterium]
MRNVSGARRQRNRYLVVCSVALGVLGIDQVTKSLAIAHLQRPVELLGPFSLELSRNSGVAFSLALGFGLPIVLLGLLALAAFGWHRRHALTMPAAVASGLIAGGALGNLADRLFRGDGGAVVDFIHSTFWPTFNVADSAVTCGCVMMFVLTFRSRGESERARVTDHPTERHDHAR